MEYHDSFDNYFVGGKKYYDCTIFYFLFKKKPSDFAWFILFFI
jgi:hypothetical protein